MKTLKNILYTLLAITSLTSTAKTFTVLDNGQTAGVLSISDKTQTNYIDNVIQVYKTNIVNLSQLITLTNYYTITNIVNSPTNTVPTPTNPPPVITNNPTSGNSWYVKNNGGASSLSGKDWNNAWNINTINWTAVQPGDTIWVAGGSYSSGLSVGKNGEAGKPIFIKRVTSGDVTATGAAGWNSSFDSRVSISSGGPLSVLNRSYIYIDGRIDMGMRFTVSNGGGLPTSLHATGSKFVTVTNVDLVGPNSSAAQYSEGQSCGTALVSFNGDSSGVNIGYGANPNPGADNLIITHSRVRGHANEFWFAGARNITIEYCKIYDNGAANSATWHGNLMIVNGSDGIIFRYNEVYNWQVEGLYPWGSVSRNWYVYGNVFRDGIGGKNGSTHRFLELRSYSGSVTHGPFYVYNNTIMNCWAAITRGDTTVYWSSTSVVKNNLVYNVANGGIGYLPSNNSNNLTASVNPFSDSEGRLSTTSQAKNAGTALSPVAGHTLNIDKDGNVRGQDGSWDVGAFEE